MADVLLLRERIKVLARTLDAVARIADGLAGAQARMSAAPAVSANAQDMLAGAREQLARLESAAPDAGFSSPRADIDFSTSVTGLRRYLDRLDQELQAPPSSTQTAIRTSQAVSSLAEAVSERRDELAELRASIEGPAALTAEARVTAWRQCLQLEVECDRLFADYLDLMSGIALRDAGLDQGLCQIADALVSDFDPFGNTRWDSLTVPATRELRDDPIAGFVRIGFPEWSVWTLPLAMVDFASYVIFQHRRTSELRAKACAALVAAARAAPAVQDELLATVLDGRALPVGAGEAEVEAALDRLAGMLLLEALATAIMGPAYAWAALLMRVDPRAGQQVAERLRRDVVLATLRRLEPRGQTAGKLALFEAEWQDLLDSAGMGPAGAIDGTLAAVVELVAEGAVERVAKLLQEQDWVLIEALAQLLHEGLDAAEVRDRIASEQHAPDLRHVLNAGWVARLEWPQDDAYVEAEPDAGPSPLSRAVRDVCLAIVSEPQAAVASSSRPAPGPSPSLPRRDP